MEQEYEFVQHEHSHYRIFAVKIVSRAPHVHGDFELGLVLDGKGLMECQGRQQTLDKGEVYLINPFTRHAFSCREPVTILSRQVPLSFFAKDCPAISRIRFDKEGILAEEDVRDQVRKELPEITEEFFMRREWFELDVSAKIRELFYFLLKRLPSRRLTQDEANAGSKRAGRMIRLTDYIDSHYQDKLFLGDIADEMGLNLCYLSHFFKDAFGVSFQTYLGKIRCEHAQQLLISTDLTLLDISIACGFSDPKYLNSTFRKECGMLPRDYRERYREKIPEVQGEMQGTLQKIFNEEEALKLVLEAERCQQSPPSLPPLS